MLRQNGDTELFKSCNKGLEGFNSKGKVLHCPTCDARSLKEYRSVPNRWSGQNPFQQRDTDPQVMRSSETSSSSSSSIIMMTILLVPLLLLSLMIIAIPASSSALAQQAAPPRDTRIIDSQTIEDQVLRDFQNSQLEDYRLWANGTAEYTFRILGAGGVLTNRTIELTTNHFYTPDRGFIYNSTGVFIGNGSQRLIIETFAGPGQ